MNIRKSIILGVVMSFFFLLILVGCNKENDVNMPAAVEPYAHPEALISPEKLKIILGKQNVTVIDTRPLAEYRQAHIPTAICMHNLSLMDPNIQGKFTNPILLSIELRKHGVRKSDNIVVYSDDYSHAPFWFLLDAYGLNVQMLNGGFEQWKAKDYPVTTGVERKNYVGNIYFKEIPTAAFIDVHKVKDIVINKTENVVIIDTRSALEYYGQAGPPGARRHLAGAVNITWDQLINEDLTFKTATELKKIFEEKGVTPGKQIIVYSYTPFEASFVYFVLDKLLGYENVKLFDTWYYYRVAEFPHER